MDIAWGGNGEEHLFLPDASRENLVDDKQVDLMKLIFPPLLPWFPRRLFNLSSWRVVLVLFKQCSNILNKVVRCAGPCTVAFLFEPRFERILCWMASGNPQIKIPSSTYLSYILKNWSNLFQRVSSYSVFKSLDRCEKLDLLASISAMMSSVAYISSK